MNSASGRAPSSRADRALAETGIRSSNGNAPTNAAFARLHADANLRAHDTAASCSARNAGSRSARARRRASKPASAPSTSPASSAVSASDAASLSRARSAAIRARSTVRSPRHAASSSQAVRIPMPENGPSAKSDACAMLHAPQANACRARNARPNAVSANARLALTAEAAPASSSAPATSSNNARGSRAVTATGSGSRPSSTARRRSSATACATVLATRVGAA